MVFIKAGGYGGIGRRDGFRCRWETVQVRVLLSALDNDNPNSVPSGNGFGFLVHNPVQRMQAAMRRTAGRGKVISLSIITTLEEDRIFDADIFPLIKELPNNVVKIWEYAFCEIMTNAIEHAKADFIWVLVKENILYTNIFIGDNGIGIFENIREYVLNTTQTAITLDEAMSILFVGKMTTNKETHSGEGIFFSSRSLDRFYIYSSNKIFAHEAYDKNMSADIRTMKDSESKEAIENENGTWVGMELWNQSKRQLKEVFDMFSSDEKGFYKTQISIKSAIPSAFPVSRSQARRLCSGFDKFEEVELDFSGVDDVGRAFVHEIFCVFLGKHPEISIRIKNANSTVESVIHSVKNTVI